MTISRRAQITTALAAPLVIAAAVAAAAASRSSTTGGASRNLLVNPGDHSSLTECVLPSTDGSYPTWASLLRTGAAWGLDELELTSKSATVTVTAAELVGTKGHITLTHVAFVPYGGAGEGFPWDTAENTSSPNWSLRQELPASLHYVALPTEQQWPSMAAGHTPWLLVVGVTVSADGGSAKAVRLTYTVDGHRYHLTGRDGFAILPVHGQCPHP